MILFVLWANVLFSQSYGTYYQSAEGLKSDALKTALNTIIKGHTTFPYTSGVTDVWDILKQTDKDPNNAANVIFLYSGQSILAGTAGNEFRNGTGWTREHVWPQSRGDFGTDFPGVGTDVHNLRPENDGVNSTRSNRSFDYCKVCESVLYNGVATGSYVDKYEYSFEPRDAVKGDVARMIFYMAVRYEGKDGELDMELTESLSGISEKNPVHGRLSTLLEWNRIDPVDDWERNRNNIIYNSFQRNRNPFIDFPNLAEYIWGNAVNATWSSTFSTFPNDGETNVEVNSTIRFVFANAVRHLDNSEITNANVSNLLSLKETDINGINVDFTANIDADKKVITLTPNSNLKYVQTYYASINAVEYADETVNNFTAISFTTRIQDVTAPTYISSPLNGANDVYNSALISFVYNEDIRNIDNSEITDANVANLFSIREINSNGAIVPFTATYNYRNRTITITPSSNLKNNQLYFVSIAPVEDYYDNATQPSTLNFTTVEISLNTRLIISQYYEGLSNDKYIEITNLGSEPVDLSTYHLGRFSNTDNPANTAVYNDGNQLSGTIAGGQTLLYRNLNAVNPAYAKTNSIASTNATFVNGDDPIALMNGGNTWQHRVDCIYASIAGGVWGLDRSFYRKATVTEGNKNMSVLDGSGEWIEASLASVANATTANSEYLGIHIFNPITDVSHLSDSEIKLYPNPSNGRFYMELGSFVYFNAKIEVFNLLGMKVYETIARDFKTEIDLSEYKQGVYYLRINNGTNTITQKIIKK